MDRKQDHFPFDAPAPGGDGPGRYPVETSINTGLSLTRLVVGGVLAGIDAMMDRLLTWEQRRRTPPETLRKRNRGGLNTTLDEERFRVASYSYDPAYERARHMWVGLVFISQERLSKGFRRLGRFPQTVFGWLQPVIHPLARGPLWRPLRYGLERLSKRGETEVERWVAIGKREEANSRQLVEIAVQHTVDQSIHYLTLNEEVQELVKIQSTGLADEAIEELRERSVSADSFLEGLVRFVLRRRPRIEIPPPPEDVRAHAARLHPERWKDR
jgi:hypothetical protein